MEKVIQVENLSYRYPKGQEEVLKDVNLAVPRGEFLAILGANGSGKSTLARHLNALLIPTKGRVQVLGLNTLVEENHWEIRSRVAMVFQNPEHQLVAPVVEEEVAFGPENLALPPSEIKIRVERALRMTGLGERALDLTQALSGGEKQKLAIAGALAMEPEILILDEATTMLDPAARKELLALAHGLNREQGMTVIFITHHLEEIIAADRVLVMGGGQGVLEETPRELFSNPGKLSALDLRLPPMAHLAHLLTQAGFSFSQFPLTMDEMVMELCRLKLTR